MFFFISYDYVFECCSSESSFVPKIHMMYTFLKRLAHLLARWHAKLKNSDALGKFARLHVYWHVGT